MKTIVITDPCYTTDGKIGLDDIRGGGGVTLDVTDEFFEVLKQKPIVEFNEKDNWDGGTYFFGGKFNIDEYDFIGNHFNDAGMTCIVDYKNVESFDWSDFCNLSFANSKKMFPCKACKGTGMGGDDKVLTTKMKKLVQENEILLEMFNRCDYCYGSGEREGDDLSVTQTHGHFLMTGSTFLGDVGASVWVRRVNDEIVALAIDVVGYTFGEEEYEDN